MWRSVASSDHGFTNLHREYIQLPYIPKPRAKDALSQPAPSPTVPAEGRADVHAGTAWMAGSEKGRETKRTLFY